MSLELLIAAVKGNLEEVKRLVEVEKVDINFVGQLDNGFLNTNDVYPETKTWCNAVTAALMTNLFLVGSAMRKKSNNDKGERSDILRYLIAKGAKIEVTIPEESKTRRTYSTTLALAFRKKLDNDVFQKIVELSEELNPSIHLYMVKPRSIIKYFFDGALIDVELMRQRFSLVFLEAILRGDKNTLCELISHDLANTRQLANPDIHLKAYIENKLLDAKQVRYACSVLDEVVIETKNQEYPLAREIALAMKYILARKILNQSDVLMVILDNLFSQNVNLRNYNTKLGRTATSLFDCVNNPKREHDDLIEFVDRNISDSKELMDVSKNTIPVENARIIHDRSTYDLLMIILDSLIEENFLLNLNLQRQQTSINKIASKIKSSVQLQLAENIFELIALQEKLMQSIKANSMIAVSLQNYVIQQFKKNDLLHDYPQFIDVVDLTFPLN